MIRETLPIARTGAESRFVLNAESLNKILQLAGNQIDTLAYLQAALKEKAGNNPEFVGLMQEVGKLVKHAEYQLQAKEKLNPWSLVVASTVNDAPRLIGLLRAHLSESEFDAFQDFLADTSIRHIAEYIKSGAIKEGQITLDYAISRSSQFMRAYSSDGNMLEGEALDAMDTLFNRWLGKNDMISEDGVIYMRTEDNIRKKNGAPVIADPDKLIAMFNGNGFEKFVQEKHPKVRITIRQNDYVEPKPTAESASQS